MKIEVPILKEDGSVEFTHVLDAKQVQALLGFALNFLTASGLIMQYGIVTPKDDNQIPLEFND